MHLPKSVFMYIVQICTEDQTTKAVDNLTYAALPKERTLQIVWRSGSALTLKLTYFLGKTHPVLSLLVELVDIVHGKEFSVKHADSVTGEEFVNLSILPNCPC